VLFGRRPFFAAWDKREILIPDALCSGSRRKPGVMVTNNVERLTFMELKILGISKAQYDKGYSGGTFTPGLVRKETSYSYQAINTSLESLISHGLLEKTVTSTEREGVPVDLDAYSITDKGLQAIEKIKSGAIKIDSSDPGFAPPSSHEPRTNFRPEERREPAQNHELAQSVKNLEATMKVITKDIKSLHGKADRMLAHVSEKPEIQIPVPQPKQRKPRALSSDALIHRVLVLDAVNELRKNWEVVLAKDVKAMYFKKCKERGLSPKGPTQFTTFLKRVQYERILSLKRVGCRNLGIKGYGSRVVVEMTQEGEEFLAKHEQSIQHFQI
jgi:predicted transcriptional regulator